MSWAYPLSMRKNWLIFSSRRDPRGKGCWTAKVWLLPSWPTMIKRREKWPPKRPTSTFGAK